MKKPILFSLLFAPIFCCGQTNTRHQLIVGVFGNQLKYENNGTPLGNDSYIFGGKTLPEKVSFSFGYRANFRKKKWNLGFGAQTKSSVFKVVCDCSSWPTEFDPNSATLYTRDPKLDDNIKTRVIDLEFPIIANWYLTQKQNLSVDFGILPAFNFAKKVKSETFMLSKNDFTKIGFFDKNISSRIGMGLKTSKKTSLHLFWSHDFKSFKPERTSIQAKRNSIGLEMGLLF
jgi:hypothetical protein